MSDPFARMARRMDAATLRRMGKTATINEQDYPVVSAEFLADMGALSGEGLSLVVFSDDYQPHRTDRVVYDGEAYSVARMSTFNGKPQIWIE